MLRIINNIYNLKIKFFPVLYVFSFQKFFFHYRLKCNRTSSPARKKNRNSCCIESSNTVNSESATDEVIFFIN